MKSSAAAVLLFYPNLIGYARISFMVLSFYFALTDYKLTLMFYLMAFGGDVVDGYVARACGQSSRFGGVLDMVTDRVSTLGFLFMLSHLYPEWKFAFVLLVSLDIFSHWFHVMR
jgi:CDP-diacylglycerol--inositol 3-phosphatidyltransferase